MAPLPPTLDNTPHDGAASNIPCNALLSSSVPKRPHIDLPVAAGRLLRALGDAAVDHPVLKPLLALHSNLQSFLKIRCRGPGVPISLSAHNFAAIIPGDSVAGLVVANGINNFLNIYNSLLVVRLVLTWFPNSPPAIVSPLSTLCDPYLNIFRGIIPPLGGTLDLSPILAFLVLNFFTSTAAALPAEIPLATAPHQQRVLSSHPMLNLTATQKKWLKRVQSKRNNKSNDVE